MHMPSGAAQFLDFTFLIDVGIKARTSFQDHGYEVTDARKILRRYLRGWFIIDLISAIPLGLFFTDPSVRIFTIVRLLRIARLVRKLDSLSVRLTARRRVAPRRRPSRCVCTVPRHAALREAKCLMREAVALPTRH